MRHVALDAVHSRRSHWIRFGHSRGFFLGGDCFGRNDDVHETGGCLRVHISDLVGLTVAVCPPSVQCDSDRRGIDNGGGCGGLRVNRGQRIWRGFGLKLEAPCDRVPNLICRDDCGTCGVGCEIGVCYHEQRRAGEDERSHCRPLSQLHRARPGARSRGDDHVGRGLKTSRVATFKHARPEISRTRSPKHERV